MDVREIKKGQWVMGLIVAATAVLALLAGLDSISSKFVPARLSDVEDVRSDLTDSISVVKDELTDDINEIEQELSADIEALERQTAQGEAYRANSRIADYQSRLAIVEANARLNPTNQQLANDVALLKRLIREQDAFYQDANQRAMAE